MTINESNIVHYFSDTEIQADQVALENSELFAGETVKTWVMNGVRKKLNIFTESNTLDINNSWSVNINTGAIGHFTLTLPVSAPAGVTYTFVKTDDTYAFVIAPGVGDTIGGFAYVTTNSVGARLSVISDGSSSWIITDEHNTTGVL